MPACTPAQETQRNHTSGDDSEIPVKEPIECNSAPRLGKAEFVITVHVAMETVTEAQRKGLDEAVAVETKFPDSIAMPHHSPTNLLSLV